MRRAVVPSFEELLRRPLADGVNALCWPRALRGDFREVAHLLAPPDGMIAVDEETLRAAPLSPAGRVAAEQMIEDLRLLDALGLEPILNCITDAARDARGLPIATDTSSFHADRAPIEVDTFLCTYWGKSTEGLDNDDARKLVDDPAIRAALRAALAAGDDDDDDERFEELLREGSFDLHYARVDGAQPFPFGVGSLWRIAVEWPGCPVPPCLHRTPPKMPGDEPRLLLIC